MLWKCLVCGHAWETDIIPTRCGATCGSYDIMPIATYNEMLDSLAPNISETTPILDVLTALGGIFKTQGIRMRRPLRMAKRLIKDAEERKKREGKSSKARMERGM